MATMMFIITYMPYKSRITNVMTIYTEFGTGVIFLLVACYSLELETSDQL